ncbi:MAG: SRPBCC family protein [Mycobacterium sp.]
MSPATIFGQRYGLIRPIEAIRDQTGDWATVGQTRTVVPSVGSMHEELVVVDAPNVFRYRLSRVTGPQAALIDHVEGEFLFTPIGTGTNVTWRWTVHPKSTAAALAMPAFAILWRGFARQGLEQLSDELLR